MLPCTGVVSGERKGPVWLRGNTHGLHHASCRAAARVKVSPGQTKVDCSQTLPPWILFAINFKSPKGTRHPLGVNKFRTEVFSHGDFPECNNVQR